MGVKSPATRKAERPGTLYGAGDTTNETSQAVSALGSKRRPYSGKENTSYQVTSNDSRSETSSASSRRLSAQTVKKQLYEANYWKRSHTKNSGSIDTQAVRKPVASGVINI